MTDFQHQRFGSASSRRLGWLAAWLLAAVLPGFAASKTSSKLPKAPEGFKPFAVIAERNVFNANRQDAPVPVAAKPAKPPKPPQTEAFALIGTMSSERGAVAFFDGTSPDFRKAAHTGEKLGDYTITAIAHDRVTLLAEERELCLPLKMQFRREDQGEWVLAPLPDDFQPSAAPPRSLQVAGSLGPSNAMADEVRDYVRGKYQRKLDELANDPAKSDKLLRAMNGEIESRLRKLGKLNRQ